MHRVVLDTNILVSSAVFGGTPRDATDRLRLSDCLQLISQPLIIELLDILTRRFRWPKRRVEAFLGEVLQNSAIIAPSFRLDACRDPDDNRILECALAGHADVIVSGDKDLLSLGSFQGIPILTARQFLDTLPA